MLQSSAATAAPPALRVIPPALRRPKAGRLLVWAVLLIVAWLVLLPFGFLVYAALRTGYPGQADGQFTLANLAAVYGTGKYLGPLFNTLQLAFCTALFATPVGMSFAWLTSRTDLGRKRLMELLLTMPLYISPLLGALAWIALAAPSSGLLNALLGRGMLGLDGNLVDVYSFGGITFVMVIYYAPLAYLMTAGSFARLDASLEEAARTIGCSPLRVWRHVTLPMLLPTTFSAALMVFIMATEQFAVPALLGVKGNFVTLPVLLYQAYENGFMPPGEVAALATLLVALTLAGIYCYRRIVGVSRRFVTISAKASAQRQVRLGRWKWVAFSYLGLYLLLAVFLPCAALLVGSFQKYLTARFTPSIWTTANYTALLQPEYIQAIGNTFTLALIGAAVTVVLGFVIGYLGSRMRGPAVAAIDYISALPIALPGIAMAVGLLWAYTPLALPIYGTAGMLLIAFVARFIGQAVRLGSTSFQQLDPSLEEAGRMSGLSPFRTLRVISLALVRPSMIAGFILIFIFIVIELATALLLFTPSTQTLSVVLFSAMETSGSVSGFTIGVVQIAIIFTALALAYRLAGNLRAPLS